MAKKVTSEIPQYNFQRWRYGIGLGEEGDVCKLDIFKFIRFGLKKTSSFIHEEYGAGLISVHGEMASDNRDKLKIWHCHIDTRRRISPGAHSATGCPGGLCGTHPWSPARLDKRNPQGFLSEVMAEPAWRWLGEDHAEVPSNLSYPVTVEIFVAEAATTASIVTA